MARTAIGEAGAGSSTEGSIGGMEVLRAGGEWERADRPFRCLDCQYRRELVRVYLTNVEQICRRFVDDKRGKLGKLLEDKARWSSFCTFWLGIDHSARGHMLREKMDMILKGTIKHFFIEKEVTSTLVMDSLYSGRKALEAQSKCTPGKAKLLLLLERATMEPLPPKDEKGSQNRTKDFTRSMSTSKKIEYKNVEVAARSTRKTRVDERERNHCR